MRDPGRLVPRRLRSRWAESVHLTPRRVLNLALVHLEMKLGRTRLLSRPYELCIDVSNKCNLACPGCATGRKEEGRSKGSMSFEMFKSIIDELAPYGVVLEMVNWGEAFFSPELPRLIEYAYRRRLKTIISSNLSFRMKEDYLRSIVRSGLTVLKASVDGADQESYEVYRRGGKFDLVMENLRTLMRLKQELNSELPRIWWQYLVFAHNEDRVGEARALAAELGLDRFCATAGLFEDPSWAPRGVAGGDGQHAPENKPGGVGPTLVSTGGGNAADGTDYSYPYLEMHPNRCVWLWNKAVFHWDGRVAACCQGFYEHDDFADWVPGTFGQIWNNEKFVAARRIWTEPLAALPQGHFCTECDKVRLYRGLPLRGRMNRPASSAASGA